MHAKSLQSCLTLYDPMDCSPPGSFVHRILQAGILEWSPFPPPANLPDLGIDPVSPVLGGRFFTTAPPGKDRTDKPRAEVTNSKSHRDQACR